MRRLSILTVIFCLALVSIFIPTTQNAQVVLAANYQHVCPGPAGPDTARCHAVVKPQASTSPTGLSPAQIKSAYNFTTSLTAGAGKTIAIVDAFDDPTAENDLNVYSAQYGLPACTTANGCFKKVNQTGGTNYPRKMLAGHSKSR